MNKSPESFIRDLAREQALDAAGDSASRELAADRSLKRELSRLDRPELPERVRNRVMSAARPHDRSPWFVAAAAAVVAAVAVAVVMRGPEPPVASPSPAQLAELGLALNTLNDAGRRAVAVTGREVSRGLDVPELGLAELPYAELVRAALRPARADSTDRPATTEENSR